MKHTKKLTSLLLALVMLFAMTATALASQSGGYYGVTIPEDGILAGHTFTAYQVFKAREEDGVLSDVDWGNGINGPAFLAALKAADPAVFNSCSTAADVAKALDDCADDNALAQQVARIAEKNKTGNGTALQQGSTALPGAGYYLIVDTTADVGQGGAYNAALLQVVGNITVNVKTDAPSVEKKVQADVDVNGGYGPGFRDVADFNIGQTTIFHLIGKVPDMSRYQTYKYTFHDTFSTGLTPPTINDPENPGSVRVYLSNSKYADLFDHEADITSNFNIAVNGQKLTVSCNNLKAISGVTQGKYIIVEYGAALNSNAVIGRPGNPNTVYLEYSNRPDQSGAGDTNNTGRTPEDKVVVFTYQLNTSKVDGQNPNTKLPNAQFVLLSSAKLSVAKVIDGKFAGWVSVPSSELPPAPPQLVITLPLLSIQGGGTTSWDPETILTSDANGLFSIKGLDAGTYYLREIKAPRYYNSLTEDIEVKITATIYNGQSWDGNPATALTALSVTANGAPGTANVATGTVGITVGNNRGYELPETGGIGTTI
ncbi:MAG TPA: isopeptide-forming domain-containing fimbrial protein [Clostridiales bacterium]|nr:isopeptide-forming domain-containing fimbrial protein [Clostridiales bacterium]